MNFSEIVLLMAIALILFGPEDLPDIARAVGKIVYEIRKATNELTDGFKDIVDSPMDSINKAFEETTKRTGDEPLNRTGEQVSLSSEPQDLITYDGKPVVEAQAPGTGAEPESTAATQASDSPKENFPDRGDDPLAELPPGMVTYEEKGASR